MTTGDLFETKEVLKRKLDGRDCIFEQLTGNVQISEKEVA